MPQLFSRLSKFLLAVLLVIPTAAAQEPDAEARQRARTQRLELMRQLVQQFRAQPLDDGEKADLTLRGEPIMRYNDPARELMDGSVWRLGETGRPHALVAVELIPMQDRYLVSYEFLAVESPTYRGQFRNFVWQPQRGFADFQPIPGGPSPAATAAARLTQMKLLARRFTAHQEWEGMNNRLRMLPQPIDRYRPSDASGADGTMFAFTFGVNPEVLLLIETDSTSWQFACLRLAGARLFVEFDGEPAWNDNPTGSRDYQNPSESYTQSRQYIRIPAVEMD